MSIDHTLLGWVQSAQPAWLDPVMVAFTWVASAGMLWLVLAGAALLHPRDRAAAWRVILTIGLAYLLVDGVVKPLIPRERPVRTEAQASRDWPAVPTSSSFTSDRAAAAFGAALALARMWPRTAALWWTLAACVGYALVYIGHHYPLDVAAAAVIGIAAALWALGGRHPATYAIAPPPPGVIVRP